MSQNFSTRRVLKKEKRLWDEIEHLDISPKFTANFDPLKDVFITLTIEKYPTTLDRYFIDNPDEKFESFEDAVYPLIDALHANGILHGNFSAENIVFDEDTRKMKIVNFAKAKYFAEITPDTIARICRFWGVDVCKDVAELCAIERTFWKKIIINDEESN